LEATCATRDHLLAVSDVVRIRRDVDRCLAFVARMNLPAEQCT
jgi:hypothetical protein